MEAKGHGDGVAMRWQEKGQDPWAQDQGHWGCDNATSTWGNWGHSPCRLLRLYPQSPTGAMGVTQGREGLQEPILSLSE